MKNSHVKSADCRFYDVILKRLDIYVFEGKISLGVLRKFCPATKFKVVSLTYSRHVVLSNKIMLKANYEKKKNRLL